jgi:hypothetical protein
MLASSTLVLLSLPRTPIVRCSGMELGWIVILWVGELVLAVYKCDLRLDYMIVGVIVYLRVRICLSIDKRDNRSNGDRSIDKSQKKSTILQNRLINLVPRLGPDLD